MKSPEALLGPLPKSPKTIFIGNGREFFSSIDPHVPLAHKNEFLQSDNDETDPMIIECGDNKLIFVPQSIDPEYINDMMRLFNYHDVAIVRPPETGNGLSSDILDNKESYNLIKTSLQNGGNTVELIPWGQTEQFEKLERALRRDNVTFVSPETPLERARWHPDYANTKLGTREILQRVQIKHPELGILLPEGFPCPNIDSALKIAKYFVDTGRGMVFKANLGAAGIGVFVFSPKEYNFKNPTDWMKMEKIVRENSILANGPVIIEEYIAPDFSKRGVFPSVDTLIRPDGTPEIQAVSTMAIRHDGDEVEFYGSTIGHGLFTPTQEAYMKAINIAVGQEHAKLGYRGWFDTDFILAKDGNLYLTETNVRRTGTTYMVDIAKQLFGQDWDKKMAMISVDKFIRPHLKNVSYPELKNKLSDMLYPINGEPRGILLTQSIRSMFGRGKFGYSVIAPNQESAEQLGDALIKRLG